MNMKFKSNLVLMILAIFASSTIALAAPTKKELQAKFEQRYPEVKKYKADGKVGETSAGFLEAVKDADGALSKLIDEENADRRALYELIATDEKVDAGVVAKRAAQRNFKKAAPGEFIKEDGKWKQK